MPSSLSFVRSSTRKRARGTSSASAGISRSSGSTRSWSARGADHPWGPWWKTTGITTGKCFALGFRLRKSTQMRTVYSVVRSAIHRSGSLWCSKSTCTRRSCPSRVRIEKRRSVWRPRSEASTKEPGTSASVAQSMRSTSAGGSTARSSSAARSRSVKRWRTRASCGDCACFMRPAPQARCHVGEQENPRVRARRRASADGHGRSAGVVSRGVRRASTSRACAAPAPCPTCVPSRSRRAP